MRFRTFFLILCCYLTTALSRTLPIEDQAQDGEADAYEDDEESEIDEASQVQEEGGGDSEANENVKAIQPVQDSKDVTTTEEPFSPQKPNAKVLTAKRRTDDFSLQAEDEKRSEEPSVRNDETLADYTNIAQSQPLHSDAFDHDQPEMAQLTKRNMKDFRNNRIEVDAAKNKPTTKVADEEDGTLLFEGDYRNRQQKSNTDVYHNEDAEQAEQPQQFNKRYYKTMDAENKGRFEQGNYENIQNSANRDRRETQETPASEIGNLTTFDKTQETPNESEESAIKRHVQKLSTSELQQLLGSLSEDKRILLQKIIDSSTGDFVDKRETEKKCGVVDENNLAENGLSDNINPQMGTSIAAISDLELANIDATEANKSPNESDLSGVLNLEKSPQPSDKPDMKPDTLGGSLGTKTAESNVAFTVEPQPNSEPELTKSDIKREANNEDYNEDEESLDEISHELSNEKDYQNIQHRLLSNEELITRSQNRKRETKKAADFAKAMKSLEESFPNPTAYEETDPYFGEDMTPLVRVKRKTDVVLKKRFAASPDAKVSYFPSNADNDKTECDEEANEFDEDRLYERTSNFEKSKEGSSYLEQTPEVETPQSKKTNDDKFCSNAVDRDLNAPKSDSSDLGSDTDSVLDGVDGVDDNLMYSSKSRDRRSTPEYLETNENIPSSAETIAKSPQYQESDAFRPLPTNYEGEQSRYKRIRGVKLMPSADDKYDA